MTLEIKKLDPNDIDKFKELISVFEAVFEMQNFSMPNNEHLLKVLSDPDFFVFAAIHKNRVIAGLTAYTLHQYYSEKPLAYIYDLAVKKAYQRQGIGKKLMAVIHTYCKENGFEEVFVQADKEEEYAVDFYRSTQPTEEEQVVHFYYNLNK